MPYIVTLEGFTPGRRYDDEPWTEVRVEESAASSGPWAALETQPLDPVDADPSDPQTRNVTTDEATLPSGWYRLVFIDEDGDEQVSDPISTAGAVGAGYPSTETLVAASSVEELTALDDTQQDALRAEAIDDIERHTGQRFVPDTDDLILDGSGGRELYLPKRVETLTGITVQGTSIDITDVVVTTDANESRIHFEAISGGYAVQAMRETAYDSRTFRRGAGTVILEGAFGWASVPSDVATAIRFEMEDRARANATELAGTVAAYRRLGMKEIAQGNLRGTLAEKVPILSPRTMARLSDYVWTGPAGYVI